MTCFNCSGMGGLQVGGGYERCPTCNGSGDSSHPLKKQPESRPTRKPRSKK